MGLLFFEAIPYIRNAAFQKDFISKTQRGFYGKKPQPSLYFGENRVFTTPENNAAKGRYPGKHKKPQCPN
jgi:hypothetical protein